MKLLAALALLASCAPPASPDAPHCLPVGTFSALALLVSDGGCAWVPGYVSGKVTFGARGFVSPTSLVSCRSERCDVTCEGFGARGVYHHDRGVAEASGLGCEVVFSVELTEIE